MSQRRALDLIQAMRRCMSSDMSIAPAVNGMAPYEGLDKQLQRIGAELIDDSKPVPVQHQGSTYEQLCSVFQLANQNGFYDAADFIMETGIKPVRNCEHPFIWPDGICLACGRLATMFPGSVEERHKVVPRRTKVQAVNNG